MDERVGVPLTRLKSGGSIVYSHVLETEQVGQDERVQGEEGIAG